MRSNAFILAVVAGFFMCQPAFSARQPGRCLNDECSMQQTCMAKKHCEKKPSKNNCNSNGCNPFMACWCGNFFLIERPFASSGLINSIDLEFAITEEEDIPGVTFECWHPPEML